VVTAAASFTTPAKTSSECGVWPGGFDEVLVLAGYTHEDEGEYIPGNSAESGGEGNRSVGGDRVDLGLGDRQEALILAAAEANPRTVVAVMSGSAVWMQRWCGRVGAILMLWYPGMQGGRALADVLLGRVDPAGCLPFSIPRRVEDLPFFDRAANSIRYDLWHGYTKLERDGIRPAFAFGFGLTYTRFQLAEPRLSLAEDAEELRVEFELRNVGERAGDCVVQIYAGWAEPSEDHPLKRLCGFRRVPLMAGESRRVEIDLSLKDLAHFDAGARCWRLGTSHWRFWIARSSADDGALACCIDLPDRRWSLRER